MRRHAAYPAATGATKPSPGFRSLALEASEAPSAPLGRRQPARGATYELLIESACELFLFRRCQTDESLQRGAPWRRRGLNSRARRDDHREPFGPRAAG